MFKCKRISCYFSLGWYQFLLSGWRDTSIESMFLYENISNCLSSIHELSNNDMLVFDSWKLMLQSFKLQFFISNSFQLLLFNHKGTRAESEFLNILLPFMDKIIKNTKISRFFLFMNIYPKSCEFWPVTSPMLRSYSYTLWWLATLSLNNFNKSITITIVSAILNQLGF